MPNNAKTILQAIWEVARKTDHDVYLSAVLVVSQLEEQVFALGLLPLVKSGHIAHDLTKVRITREGYAELQGSG